MTRIPKLWFSANRGNKIGWWLTVDGRHEWLQAHPKDQRPPKKAQGRWSPIPSDIEGLWLKRVALIASTNKLDMNATGAIFEAYLTHLVPIYGDKDRTFPQIKDCLQRFGEFVLNGRSVALTPVSELTTTHLMGWLDTIRSRDGESPAKQNTRSNKTIIIMRAFYWAAGKTSRFDAFACDPPLIKTHPYAGKVHVPEMQSSAVFITKHEFCLLMKAARTRSFQMALFALYYSGCRPDELVRLNADMVDLNKALPQWRWRNPNTGRHEHKTAASGKVRKHVLTGKLLLITTILMQKRSDGEPLFQSPRGCRWTHTTLDAMLKKAATKAKIKRNLTLMGVGRHSYATNALMATQDVPFVKAQMGHARKSLVLEHHYSHVLENFDYMKAQAQKTFRKPR